MRSYVKCPKCGLISHDEILLTVPIFRAMISDRLICKCQPLPESASRAYIMDGVELQCQAELAAIHSESKIN